MNLKRLVSEARVRTRKYYEKLKKQVYSKKVLKSIFDKGIPVYADNFKIKTISFEIFITFSDYQQMISSKIYYCAFIPENNCIPPLLKISYNLINFIAFP